MDTNDSTPDESDFRRELEAPLGRLVGPAGPCPNPDLLMAARAGVLPGQADTIREHVRRCAVCQQLAEDLLAYEHHGVTPEDNRRIRAKWRARPVWIVWAAVAAAVLVLAGLTFTLLAVARLKTR
jgi:hypothetical protein